MREKPNDAILNRQEAIKVADEHLSRQTALLRELANYGSNLVLRALNSSPKAITDIVVCGVLLKQVVMMVDATEVLVSAGCGNAALLPARTAFEASIYMDWILEGDSDRRARRYVVANYRDERLWAKRTTPGTTEEAVLKRLMEPHLVDVHASRPNLAAEIAAALIEADRALSTPTLATIDQEFTAARKKRKHDPHWYELDGLTSIRHLAEKVGRLAEYELFYSRGSQVTHTGTYKDHVVFKGHGEIRFKPVRHLAEAQALFNFVASTCIGTYRKTLDHYRPAEREAFNRLYLEDWREAFLNVPRLNYDF